MTTTVRVEAVLRQAGVVDTIQTVTQVAPIASPMCRAVDWTSLRVTTSDDAWFIKLREPDAADFVTVSHAAAGARVAGAAGVGPALRFADSDMGVMGFELLPPPWREAGLSDVADPSVLAAVIAAKKMLQAGPELQRQWDVFTQIETLAQELREKPSDLPALLHAVTEIRLALGAAGQDSVPSHADGVVSNIMMHPDGRIRLVDFDSAGMTDPHYDLGVVLNESCALDAEWQAGCEIAFGRYTVRELNRCRLYAIADDLLWGLWGFSRHAVSARSEVEFLKYGYWRLLRCRMALRRPQHGDSLHHL